MSTGTLERIAQSSERLSLPVTGNCLHCGEETVAPNGGKTAPSYCSEEHRAAWRKTMRSMSTDDFKEFLTGECVNCGGETVAQHGNITPSPYCSRACQLAVKRQELEQKIADILGPEEKGKCRWCKTPTTPKGEGREAPAYCCGEHSTLYRKLRKALSKGKSPDVVINRPEDTNKCLLCGTTTYAPKKGNTAPSYCSPAHKNKYRKQQRAKEATAVREEKESNPGAAGSCRNCGEKTVAPNGGDTPPSYCSKVCGSAYRMHLKRKQAEATCLHCNTVFSRSYEDSLCYCSDDCLTADMSQRRKEWADKHPRRNHHNCSNFRGKFRYASIEEAYEQIDRIDPDMRAYPCFTCGAIHIGHAHGYEHELEFLPRPTSIPAPAPVVLYEVTLMSA